MQDRPQHLSQEIAGEGRRCLPCACSLGFQPAEKGVTESNRDDACIAVSRLQKQQARRACATRVRVAQASSLPKWGGRRQSDRMLILRWPDCKKTAAGRLRYHVCGAGNRLAELG